MRDEVARAEDGRVKDTHTVQSYAPYNSRTIDERARGSKVL
jgi:hypothetical protein